MAAFTAVTLLVYTIWTRGCHCVPTASAILSNMSDFDQDSEDAGDASKPCYFDICVCSGTLVNCEYGNLTFIPKFWSNITQVNLTDNELHLIDLDTFYNLTFLNVEFLSLAWNNVTSISADAFTALPDLKHLDLSGNTFLKTSVLASAFRGLNLSPLQSLTLMLMELKHIPQDMFAGLGNTSLKYLVIARNYIEEYDQDAFSALKNIRVIEANGNRIKSIKWGHAHRLSKLYLDGNDISKVPSFCTFTSASYYPKLKVLTLEHNSIYHIVTGVFGCLPNLQTLGLNNNPFGGLKTNTFANLPRLKTIFLQNLRGLATYIEGNAFNNSNLKRITLKGSQIIFKQAVSPNAFSGCTGLDSLDISFNNIYGLTDAMYESLFKDLHNITGLAIGGCKLDKIPRVIYNSLHNIRYLKIYNNRIKSLPETLFLKLKLLTHFYVNENKITSFHEEMFPISVRKQLKVLNLANNPFACTCEIQWLLKWANIDHKKFQQFPYFYQCYTPQEYAKLVITKVSMSEQFCMFQRMVYVVILGTIVPAMLVLVICSLVYRWRWQIRYLLYRLKHQGFPRPAEEHFTYDSFVVYSTDETNWVIQNLIPNLEDRAGLALCVHERDFDVGGAIVDNIVESIEASRKVLIIVSKKTLESQWCQFEISFAQERSLKAAPGSLVVILKEDIESRHMSNNIRTLLDLHTYIMWPADDNDIDARNLFWERLEAAING